MLYSFTMNTDFIKETQYILNMSQWQSNVVSEYNRLHSEDAVQAMYDNDKMTGDKDIQLAFWDGLHFGLSDKFTKLHFHVRLPQKIASSWYHHQQKDLTVDEIMDMAWTETCPDEEMPEGYTVADPVEPEDAVVPVSKRKSS